MSYDQTQSLMSWGRYPTVKQAVYSALSPLRIEPSAWGSNWLPYGNGRSYGDVCLNEGGILVPTRRLDKFLSFDKQSGLLTVESGVLLSEILSVAVPQGFFLPVTPGTKFVTVGGAIANDVHGKNHHRAGTFGHHVTRLSLLRSDGTIYECSLQENEALFRATVAGMGLTGLILNATIKMIPIVSDQIAQETIKFETLTEFFQISSQSEAKYDYTVAWIDCIKAAPHLGRGHMICGNHSDVAGTLCAGKAPKLALPFNFPSWLLNGTTVGVFNEVYYQRQRSKLKKRSVHYDPFFYPLDGILNWNRMYGKEGFVQFQTVIPKPEAQAAVTEILKIASASGMGSFLAVLKEFGQMKSVGALSFSRPGVTLCLDFPMRAHKTVPLMQRLEQITVDSGGALYSAKDALMSAASYAQMYPALSEFTKWIDPHCSSSFARRVGII